MPDLKLLTKPTVAGEKLLFKFDRFGDKFLVRNRSGGDIYVNMSNDVDEFTGWPLEDGETLSLVENENPAWRDRYTDVVSVLAEATSDAKKGVTVHMVNFD